MQAQKTGAWKHTVIFTMLIVCLVALGVRHYTLIRNDGQRLTALALGHQRMTIREPGRPGNIYFASGKTYLPAAISRQLPSCFADPGEIRPEQIRQVCSDVARVLNTSAQELEKKIVDRMHTRFVWLARHITSQQAEELKALGYRGIGIQHEWRREYPNRELGSTVIGFPPAQGAPGTGAGVEKVFSDLLKPQDGKRVSLTDASRRQLTALDHLRELPVDGANILLYLDATIQDALESAVRGALEKYEAQWVVGVVVDPCTGAVLGMTSYPTFNPQEYWKAPAENRTNRAITFPYEPGSVAKPIFSAAAVEAGTVTYQTRIFCENGVYVMPRAGRVSDHGQHFGWLTVADGIKVSSNILMAKLGQMMGNANLHETSLRFGLGQKSGIDLPGEEPGIIRPLHKWNTYSTPRVPFGQEMAVTALQMTMAFAALVNGGELLVPHVVDRILDANGQLIWQSQPTAVRRVISPSVSAQTLRVLTDVVEDGTGSRARMSRWTSFGKTGTAQVPGIGGYEPNAYTGTYVGGAPADNPRVICLISVHKPKRSLGYYGGTVAAPYVKDVLERAMVYYDIPPDRHAPGLAGR